MISRLAVVLKQDAPEAVGALQLVQAQFPGLQLLGEATGSYALPKAITGVPRLAAAELAAAAELVLVLGGDGTLIHAASLLQDRPTPILGVNLGTIGFLTEVRPSQLTAALTAALAGQLEAHTRMRLDVVVERDGRPLLQRRVLNDAVITSRTLARIATFAVRLEGALVTQVRGDGVIFATPTGSTAYSLASGGPIVSPSLEAISITPICPHQLTQRPLVVPAVGELVVTLNSDSSAFVSLDGHAGQDMLRGDCVRLRAAPVPTQLLVLPDHSYFNTLRTKLHWGQG